MSEYIKKDRAKELLCSMCKNGDYGCFGSNRCQWLKWVEESVVDAVKVVRCWKCKHCDPENHHCDHHMGTAAPLRRKHDDFCSYGERKDGDK